MNDDEKIWKTMAPFFSIKSTMMKRFGKLWLHFFPSKSKVSNKIVIREGKKLIKNDFKYTEIVNNILLKN